MFFICCLFFLSRQSGCSSVVVVTVVPTCVLPIYFINFQDPGGGGGVTAKLKNTRNILRSTEFFLICCGTATIFSMDSSLSARAVALAAEQARPEAGAGAELRDSALIGEGEPLGLLPPSVDRKSVV